MDSGEVPSKKRTEHNLILSKFIVFQKSDPKKVQLIIITIINVITIIIINTATIIYM